MRRNNQKYIAANQPLSGKPIYLNVRLQLREEQPLSSETPVDTREAAENLIDEYISEMPSEYFCVLNMNSREKPINFSVTAVGSINSSVAPMNMLFARSILSGAKAIEVFHNHPSGLTQPSQEDIAITEKIAEVCRFLHLKFVNHRIVGYDPMGRLAVYDFKPKEPKPSFLHESAQMSFAETNVLPKVSLKMDRASHMFDAANGKEIPMPYAQRIQCFDTLQSVQDHFQSNTALKKNGVGVLFLNTHMHPLGEKIYQSAEESPTRFFASVDAYKDVCETALKLNAVNLLMYINTPSVDSDDLQTYQHMAKAFCRLLDLKVLDIATPDNSCMQSGINCDMSEQEMQDVRNNVFRANDLVQKQKKQLQAVQRRNAQKRAMQR